MKQRALFHALVLSSAGKSEGKKENTWNFDRFQ
jgi:hypothetical protein